MIKKIFTIVLLISFLLICTSCNFFKKITCVHEYKSERIEPTCYKVGAIINKCIKCEDTKTSILNPLNHQFVEKNDPATCLHDGINGEICVICGEGNYEVTPKLNHKFSSWELIKKATEFDDGIERRICSLCNSVEDRIIASISYINLNIIKYQFDKNKDYVISSLDELQLLYDSIILNDIEEFTCTLDFVVDDADTLFNSLSENCSISKNFNTSFTISGNLLTLKIKYNGKPLYKASENNHYIQLNSLNKAKYPNTRSSDFDDFKINNATYSYKCNTSEQLLYALERRVLPICEVGSEAYIIYNKAKEILRQIISCDMTTIEKVKAIHDYLIMNITYDNALYELLYTNPTNLKDHRGFFLEGALLDNRAVCEGISKAFVILAQIEGIPCVFVSGNQTNNVNGPGHAWNKINIDGKWYIIDATSDGVIVSNNEVLTYNYFLISEDTMKTKYTGTTFTNILCNEDYDSFSSFTYNTTNKTYNLEIKEKQQLVDLLTYLKTIELNNTTIQLKITYTTSSDVYKSDISTILGSFRSIENGNLITIFF